MEGNSLPRRAIRGLTTIAAWGLLAFASLFAGAAEAQDRTLASNLGQSTNAFGRAFYAQAFTTGDQPGGYNLTSVTVNVANTADFSGGIRVQILTPNADGKPGATLATLIAPNSIADGDLTFMVDEHFTSGTRYLALEANETYFVYITNSAGNGFPEGNFSRTNSTSEDSSGLLDWSIDNGVFAKVRVSDAWGSASSPALKIGLTGSVRGTVASTTVNTLVSNFSQTNTLSGASRIAQPFTTGPGDGYGHDLDSVLLKLELTSLATTGARVEIRSRNADDTPGAVVYTLISPDSLADGDATFTAPANAVLEENTTYFLHISNARGSDGVEFQYRRTSSTSEDSGRASGWTIGNFHYRRDGSNWTTQTTSILKVRIRGSKRTESEFQADSAAALTSNFRQTAATSSNDVYSQRFRTGRNKAGYHLASVALKASVHDNVDPSLAVTIKESDSNGLPKAPPVYTLTSPDTVYEGVVTFTAPSGATLKPNTNYFVETSASGLLEPTNVFLGRTSSHAEDPGGARGWSIANWLYRKDTTLSPTATQDNRHVLYVRIKGSPHPNSTDAALSDIDLIRGTVDFLTLSPTFDPDTLTYTASVPDFETQLTVLPTTRHDGAAVAYFDGRDRPITDLNMSEDGLQLGLGVGTNTIKIRVTAQDDVTRQTYTVEVTRPARPLDGKFVSNTGQTLRAQGVSVESGSAYAQYFTTGDHSTGYELTAVVAKLKDVGANALPVVNIYSSTSGLVPDQRLFTLTNPSSFLDGDNTFTAPAGARLDPSTAYQIVFENGGSDSYLIRETASDSEDGDSTEKWSIGDARRGLTDIGWIEDRDSGALTVAVHGDNALEVGLWSRTMTIGSDGETNPKLGFTTLGSDTFGNVGTTTQQNFTLDSTTYRVREIVASATVVSLSVGSGAADLSDLVLEWAGEILPFSAATRVTNRFEWGDTWLQANAPQLSSVNYETTLPVDATGTVCLRTGSQSCADTSLSGGRRRASGSPSIEGRPQVGHDLTVSLGSIRDENGLPAGFPDGYSFEWKRFDLGGLSPVDIDNDSNVYTLIEADRGNQVSVTVSFTDNAGYSEARTSAAFPAHRVIVAAQTACPGDNEWCAEMTVGESGGFQGYRESSFGELDVPTFDRGGTNYRVSSIEISDDHVFLVFENAYLPRGTVFNLGGIPFTAEESAEDTSRYGYVWDRPSSLLPWLFRQQVTVSANLPPLLTTADVAGTSLVLNYHESLDSSSEPATSDFEVTVDGTSVALTDVTVSGTSVTLTLASAVTAAGQLVTLDYTAPSTNPLQDASGIDAASFASRSVRNNTGGNMGASGMPSISGVAQVGQQLTAGLGDLADLDGLPANFPDDFTIQWIREDTDGGNATEIGSGTETYTITGADEGKKIRVQVSFADIANNRETVISEPYPSGTGAVAPALTGCPTGNAWCAEMIVGENAPVRLISLGYGANGEFGSLSDDSFGVGSRSFQVLGVQYDPSANSLVVELDASLPLNSIFTIDSEQYTVTAANEQTTTGTYSWEPSPPLTWADGQKIRVSMSLPANEMATGSLGITGLARVSNTLTADLSGISDGNGLDHAVFEYQWVRTSSGTDTNIPDATQAEYDMTTADLGATIKLRLRFTDDAGYVEGPFFSAASATVAAMPLNGCEPNEVRLVGGGAIAHQGEVQVCHDNEWRYVCDNQWDANDAAVACRVAGYPDAVVATRQSTFQEVALNTGFWLDEVQCVGNEDTLGQCRRNDWGAHSCNLDQAAGAICASSANNAATGSPELSGVAQVDSELTVDISGIMDTDGLGSPDWSYTWYRVRADGSSRESETGYDSNTETLPENWVGARAEVDVLFQDDGNAYELLTTNRTNVILPPPADCPGDVSHVWCTTLTVGTAGASKAGYDSPANLGEIGQTRFRHDDVTYTVTRLYAGPDNNLFFSTSPPIGPGFSLHVQKFSGFLNLPLTQASLGQDNIWVAPGALDAPAATTLLNDVPLLRVLESGQRAADTTQAGARLTVYLSHETNTAAGGSIAIVGHANVSQTLKVDLTGIDDANGRTQADAGVAGFRYVYRWIRVDADGMSNPFVRIESPNPVYTLRQDEFGKRMKVEVSFRDDANYLEEFTSDPFPASGTVGAENNKPVFDEGSAAERNFDETLLDNVAGSAFDIGAPFVVSDADGDTVTLSLEGEDADLFEFDPATGQLSGKAGTIYNFETKSAYSVRIKAEDEKAGITFIDVSIEVNDLDEPPPPPGTITITVGGPHFFLVAWVAHEGDLRPPTDSYNLRYKKTADTAWIDGPQNVPASPVRLTELEADTFYDVQVQAVNAEGPSEWSTTASINTGTQDSNSAPEFDDDASASRDLKEAIGGAAEKSARDVGAPVTVTDADGDTLVYSITGDDAALFSFDPDTAQLTTLVDEIYDHEAVASYSLTIAVTDYNYTVEIPVTVNVLDEDEPPLAPASPVVTPDAGSPTALDVAWDAPENVGRPEIDRYLLQYREDGETGSWTSVDEVFTSTLETTITGLAEETSYEVQVQAGNDEGTGDWSASGVGATALPDFPTLSFSSDEYSAIEGVQDAQVTVRLMPAAETEVTVSLSVEELGGADSSEYSGIPASLTFAPGETEQTFEVTAEADSNAETGEAVQITIGTPGPGILLGDPATASVALLDDAGVATWYVFFEESEYTATEGGDAATVTVGLSSPWMPEFNDELTIPLRIREEKGRVDSSDYSGIPETVTFPPGETRVSFDVTAEDDSDNDDGESVVLGFGNWNIGDLEIGQGPATTTVRLADNDGVLPVVASFDKHSYSVEEGDSVDVTVNLDQAPARAVSIPLEIEYGNRASSSDLSGVPANVNFAANEKAKTFTLRANNDRSNDDLEFVRLKLVNPPNKVSLAAPRETTINIQDTDGGQPMATIGFSGDSHRRAMEGGNTLGFTVTMHPPQDRTILIPIEVEHFGGADASDYTGVPTTLEILRGESRASFQFRLVDDADDEEGEYVILKFVNLSDGVEADPDEAQVRVDFVDNEGLPTVRVSGGSAIEERLRNLVRPQISFGVNLEYGVDFVVRVDYETVDGTASAGSDYLPVSGTLIFGRGQRSKSVKVKICHDGIEEVTEEFYLKISNPVRARITGNDSAAGRIFNRDTKLIHPCATGLSVEDASAGEPHRLETHSDMEFEVRLNQADEAQVTVDYRTFDRTANAGQDYTATSGTLTFTPGETSKTVAVPILKDDHNDHGETLGLRLSNPSGAYIGKDEAVGTINNSGPMPGAWLSRFGRAAADQAVQSVGERVRDGMRPEQPNQLILGGRRVDNFFSPPARTPQARAEAELLIDPRLLAGEHIPGGSGFMPRIGSMNDSAQGAGLQNENPVKDFGVDSGLINESPITNGSTMGTGFVIGGGTPTGAGMMGAGSMAASPMGAGGMMNGGAMGAGSMGGGSMGMGSMDGSMGGSMQGGSMNGPTGGGQPLGSGLPQPLITRQLGPVALPSGGSADPGPGAMYDAGDRRLIPTMRDLMRGASFDYSRPVDADSDARPGLLGDWSAWGRSAESRFSGVEDLLSISGEVRTGTVGFDSRWNRWTGGVAVSYSEGFGRYISPASPGGTVSSTLTTVLPYAGYSLDNRTSLWAALGYGAGDLTLTPGRAGDTHLPGIGSTWDTHSPGSTWDTHTPDWGIDTGLSTRLAAFGGRGAFDARIAGIELAWVSDAFLTETESETVQGLQGATGASSRARLMLEGSGNVNLLGGVISPRLEAGLRYDGGDAETGAGVEVGGGLQYAAGRLTVQLNARGLLAHQDSAYEEWGYSGSVEYRPGEERRGLSMRLGTDWGASQSGVQSMWSQADASRMARGGMPMDAAQSVQAELGYGFRRRYSPWYWEPFLAAESAHGNQGMRLGLKLGSGLWLEAGLEFARRVMGPNQTEQAVQLNGQIRW